MSKSSILIRIGNTGYRDENALRFCFSKAQAIRVLRNRGVLRDKARKVVNDILLEPNGGAYVQGIEICNSAQAVREGYYVPSIMRKCWKQHSEF